MKGKWMRGISVLMSIVMLLMLCPVLPAMAEEDVLTIVDLDFEDYDVGAAPPVDPKGFDGKKSAVTDLARMYVEYDGDNKVLKAYHGNPAGDQDRKPRLDKTFSLTGLTNLTISYRVKSSGGSATANIGYINADTNKAIAWSDAPSNYKEWTNIKVHLDVKNGISRVYVNDKKYGGAISVDLSGAEKFTIRLAADAKVDGSWVMVDDFKVTTTDAKYRINAAPPVPELTTPYKRADHLPESGDLLVLLDEDFESQTVGQAPEMRAAGGFSGSAITDEARMYVEKDTDGNQVLKAYHGAPDAPGETAHAPRVDKYIILNGIKKLTVDVDIKTSGGDTQFPNINLVHVSKNSPTYVEMIPTSNSSDWIHVKVRYDFVAKKAKMYIDGKLHSEKDINMQGVDQCRLRIKNVVQLDGSYSMIDNVLLTSPDKDAGGLIGFDGASVNWDKLVVADEDKTGFGDVMIHSHPRLWVTDWQDIYDKVATDTYAAQWSDAVIDYAESVLKREPIQYYRNARDNLNDCSTDFKMDIIPVALAYKLTGDVRFKNRVYQDLENAGNWPDWGADAWLCTAHMNLAYAVCYDWLYNDWTPEERANILGWIKKHGLREAVLAYEGFGSSHSWKTGRNNWNPVCNGSNTVLALAIYDEMPDAAEYILGKVAVGLPHFFEEITPDGGFVETVGYWGYAFRHMSKLMGALDSSLIPGEKLPEILDFKDTPGLDKICDFPIYYNGTTGAFNYGDGSSGIVASSLMFYMAKKFNKPEYAWYMLNLRESNPLVGTLSGKEAAFALIWYDPACVAAGELALDKFYKSNVPYGTNGISMRSSHTDHNALVAMMHAGDSKASHSNLDAGGFVLDWMGKRWVHMYGREPMPDIPGGVYSWPNYHDKVEQGGHFDYYHARAEANNTIIANPKQDMPDMYYQYFAEVERYDSADNKAFGIVDMTQTNVDYEKAKRGMMLTGNRDIMILQDEIVAKIPSEYYWFVNTDAEITITPDGKSALWEYDGDKMLVRITQGPTDAKFAIMPTAPLPTSPNPDVQPAIPGHKMYIHVTNQQTLNLTVEFVPLAEGEGVPAPQPIVALDNWSVDGSAPKTTSQSLEGVLALKVDNPNAFARGKKTYVDTANLEIKPLVQNGRTLVPVRFISENIGATVSWDDATRTVGIKTDAKNITLQLGSNQMIVDGNVVTLDVPAQEISGRTLIPLRALVEALGKQVFWDDRGLILITDAPVTFDADKINKIIDLLDVRVQANGQEIKFFDSEVYNYNVQIARGAAIPTLSVISDKEVVVAQGNPATVTADDKVYTFNFVENPFEGLLGTGSEGIAKTFIVTVKNSDTIPNYQTYLDIVSATSSVEWSEKYPMTGTYDGVINDTTQNRWSANGVGNYVTYDFGSVKNLHSVAISGYKALSRSYKFDIEVSTDGVNFTKVCADAKTDLGVDRNVFKVGDVQARFVRVTGTYSSNSSWIGISEIRFYDSEQMEKDDQGAWNYYFYTSSINAMEGAVMQLEIEGKSKSGDPVAINIADVKFTSDNPAIATVDANGVITLHKTDKTVVRVEYDSMGIKTYSAVDVNVEPKI